MTSTRGPLVALAVACAAALALLDIPASAADGGAEVLAWGLDNTHQAGGDPGDTRPRPHVTPVCLDDDRRCRTELAGAVDVEAGNGHSLALLADGTVRAWGYGEDGQLGDGGRDTRPAPRTVCAVGQETPDCAPLTGVKDLSTSEDHNLAIIEPGPGTAPHVVAWGEGGSGRLGDGDNRDRRTPVVVCGAEAGGPCEGGAAAVSAGRAHSLALRADGRVLAWGSNADGQLGTGEAQEERAPVPVPLCPDEPQGCRAVAIAAGSRHSAAVLADGRVLTWGSNEHGQLGDGAKGGKRPRPGVVGSVQGPALAVAAGDAHTAVLVERAGGAVMTWGDNSKAQLGAAPDAAAWRGEAGWVCAEEGGGGCAGAELGGVAEVDANDHYTVVVTDDGAVLAWGNNEFSQLGTGSGGTRPHPGAPLAADQSPLVGVGRVSAGGGHVLALRRPSP